MKKKLLILLFCVFTFSHSQNSGSVFYKVKLSSNLFDKEEIKINKHFELINSALNENTNKFKFILKFNKKESLFNTINQMAPENISRKHKMAKILIGAKEVFYFNTELDLKLTKKNAFGQNFIIKDSISQTKWKLMNESKNIDSYICYKAITSKKLINSKGIFYSDVIAWYCPKLPYKFGPKGYGNLPGLILELQDDKFVYYATKIEFNKEKTINVVRPKKGKLVTKAEYLKIVLGTEISFGGN